MADLMAQAGDEVRAVLMRSLAVLERALSDGEWLVGDGFSIADLNVACPCRRHARRKLISRPCPMCGTGWTAVMAPAAVVARRRHGA
jgi:glutathione S-transferase